MYAIRNVVRLAILSILAAVLVMSSTVTLAAAQRDGEAEGSKVVPSTTHKFDAGKIDRAREQSKGGQPAWVKQHVAATVQAAKAAGVNISEHQVSVVDLGNDTIAVENRLKLSSYEAVFVDEVDDSMPIHFDIGTTPEVEPGHGLFLARGPGSHAYGYYKSATLVMTWKDRGEATVVSKKAKHTRKIEDGNTGTWKDLWGYSKKVLVEPKRQGGFTEDIVKKIYVSAWPTSGSRSSITGWHDWEPWRSSGSCVTWLEVGVGPVAVPLTDCDNYTRWVRHRGGTDYWYGAMGVTYDQGFIVSDGDREAGMAVSVKVKVGGHPYWNDRLTVTMGLYRGGVLNETKSCTTYAYAGSVSCYS